ncbi:MAG: S8 family peptidase [bacterium]
MSNRKWPNSQLKIVLLLLGALCLSFSPARCEAVLLPPGAAGIVPASFRFFNAGPFAPNEVIFRVRAGANQAQVSRLLSSQGIRGTEGSIRAGFQRAVLPANNALEVAAILSRDPAIEYAEPNGWAWAELFPNDPYYKYQWNFPMINMELAWDISTGANVVVAVVDTGVAFENNGLYLQAPDLAGTRFAPGWDFVNNDAYPDDDNGHGTHMAGTIAQTTNNLLGVAGIAHGCTIMPVKVLDSASNGLFTDIADGIYYAVNNGAKIINISFGTYTASVTLQDAVAYAYQNGVSVITSAGNNASSIPHYPSSYPTCVCVSAVRYDKTRPFYSNYGPDIDVCAPGGDLSVDQNLDGYQDGIVQQTHDGKTYYQFNYALYQGTSCAAAHTSGVAALAQSVAGNTLTPDAVKTLLETTAVDLGTAGWDQDFGWGLINALNAVQAALPAPAAAVAGGLVPWGLSPLNPVLPLLSQPTPLTPLVGTGLVNLALAELTNSLFLSGILNLSAQAGNSKTNALSPFAGSGSVSNRLRLKDSLASSGSSWQSGESSFQQQTWLFRPVNQVSAWENPLVNQLSPFVNPLSLLSPLSIFVNPLSTIQFPYYSYSGS